MAFENFEQAAEALAASNNEGADSGTYAPTVPNTVVEDAPNQPSVPATQGDQPVETTTPAEPEQFLDRSQIDLSNLTPEQRDYLDAREREMQAAFTRKTQTLAETQREAAQAIEFLDALNTNPEFALQVHQRLSQELQNMGYSVAEANAAASGELANAGYEEDASEYEDDPYLSRIHQIENWVQTQEQRIREAEVGARLEGDIAKIRSINPEYDDSDIRDIVSMGYAFGGNLIQAADAYKQINQRQIERYLAQKASVPASLNQPSSGGHGETPPEPFKGLDDPRLESAALRRLQESGALD
ncbi:MAG TPA: hypothetical protein VIY48_03140 [Candidatus Paceibacterota bacterium]